MAVVLLPSPLSVSTQVRHLQFLGLMVTEGDSAGGGVSRIQRMASKAQERYPTAVALGGILRTYSQTRQDGNAVLVLTSHSQASTREEQTWFRCRCFGASITLRMLIARFIVQYSS